MLSLGNSAETLYHLGKLEGLAMTADLTQVTKNALIEELEHWRNEVRKLVEPVAEPDLWQKPVEPGNSVGHLILHLTGNLNHFIGGQLGQTGYVRDREREFTDANPPAKADLLAGLDAAVATFRKVVGGLTAEQLAGPHPEERLGLVMKALVHLVSHFALHRGQMTYILRMVNQEPELRRSQ